MVSHLDSGLRSCRRVILIVTHQRIFLCGDDRRAESGFAKRRAYST